MPEQMASDAVVVFHARPCGLPSAIRAWHGRRTVSRLRVALLPLLLLGIAACGSSSSTEDPFAVVEADLENPPATPKAHCGPGSRPESGLQGRLSQSDIDSGLALEGITCNTEIVGAYTRPSPIASIGGWKVERYVDQQGHECAYYDATDIFPLGILDDAIGVNVLDMSDPAHPAFVRHLTSLAMLSPHESLVLNQKRGLLVAVMGNPAFGPGVIDIYDVSQNCLDPQLKSSTLQLTFGHESGMSPDGLTFFASSPITPTLAAIDISDPAVPKELWFSGRFGHGVSVSDDGMRAYVSDAAGKVVIFDISEIKTRKLLPNVPEISEISWKTGSIPQNTMPVTIKGKPYLVEVDEFGALSKVGAARIIDISDETHPKVISNLRLEVHDPANFEMIARDPGTDSKAYGSYAAHYCNVPSRIDPPIVACSMLASGLRVFDIRDPYHPREVAYFHPPLNSSALGGPKSNAAQSSPAFVPERKEIWFSDANSGFFAVRVTNGAWP